MLDHHELIRSAESLPPLPLSASKLLEIMNQSSPDTKAMIDVISHDPIMTAKLLRLANSAWAGCAARVGNAKEAVLRLGAATVFGLAMGSAALPLMQGGASNYDLDGAKYWKHSVQAALTVERAKRRAGVKWSSFAFTAALLHDIGKLVLGPFLTPFWRRIMKEAQDSAHLDRPAAESEVLGVNHAEVGALVAQHWRLPEVIVQGIGYHHLPNAISDNIGHVMAMANGVAHRLEGDAEHDVSESLAVLAICPDDFEALCEEVRRDAEEMARQFA